MSKEKQIDIDIAVEEMASAIREITVKCGKCEYYKDGSCLKPFDMGCDIDEDILNACDALYNAGYRKVTRCKDCVYSYFNTSSERYTCDREYPRRHVEEDDFCNYAKKKGSVE